MFSFYFALMVEEELFGYRSAIHHELPDDDTTSDPKFCNRALARVQKTRDRGSSCRSDHHLELCRSIPEFDSSIPLV